MMEQAQNPDAPRDSRSFRIVGGRPVFDDDGEESVETEAELEAELEAEQVDPADLTAMECKTKGNECLQKKDYDGAITWYTTAIDKDPTNHIFYSNRSAAYLQNNNFDAAVRDGMKTSSLKPDWAKGYNRSGCALHALGEYKKAITVLTVGLDTCFLGPDRCWMIDNPAAKLLLDPLKKAKECLQSDEMDAACLEQYDHSASTYHDLGLLYFHGHGGQKKNMKKSIKYLTIAAETYSLPQAFGQLGIMYQENENLLPVAERSNEKSLDLYTRGVALDDPVSLFNLGMLYAQGSCGVEQSFDKARELWIDASDKRHVNSASYSQAVAALERLEFDMEASRVQERNEERP